METFQNNEEKRIVIIICFYGSFPWYFSFFLHSCAYNRGIDFFIITDNKINEKLPDNVRIIPLRWKELISKINRQLGFEVDISFPYKLADFKPAYGVIFPELIKGYDFWGHGDLDIIFGDIRLFITDQMLGNHDLICVRHDIISGYFLLFRNCKEMNELFMKSRDFEKALSSEKYYNFDECNFAFKAFKEGLALDEIESEIESMNHVVRRMHEAGKIRPHFDFLVIEGKPGQLRWERGKLMFKNQFEVMLYHLVRFKRTCKPSKMKKIPDRFYISPTRIYA